MLLLWIGVAGCEASYQLSQPSANGVVPPSKGLRQDLQCLLEDDVGSAHD